MPLIAIELNDSGLMAAGGSPPQLLAVDGALFESPGYLLPQKKNVVVGKAAEGQAHLFPYQIQNRFWDQLSAEQLKQAQPDIGSHAHMAHTHLAHVWNHIKAFGKSILFSLPGSFSREQMGLLLGIAQELDVDVKGLVNQAVVVAPRPFETSNLLYLDVSLHRTEISLLTQHDYLEHQKTLTLDKGLIGLYRSWIETIATEFVDRTRFDPLHNAASEQDLYNRLPEILAQLNLDTAVPVDVRADHSIHTITLAQDTLVKKHHGYFDQLDDLIRNMLGLNALDAGGAVFMLSHRLARLPGIQSYLSKRYHAETLALEPGAGALNLLRIWDRLKQPAAEAGAFFFSRRPWSPPAREVNPPDSKEPQPPRRPTHLLYQDVAYGIDESPLAVIRQTTSRGVALVLARRTDAPAEAMCTVHRDGGDVILTVTGPDKVYLNDEAVQGRIALSLGRVLRFEAVHESLRLIACA